MKLVTRRSVIEGIAAAWERQFGPDPERPKCRAILSTLRSLDLGVATESQIARIIGNRSWTRIECIECGQDQDEAFHLGGAEETVDQPVYLCRSCLEKAAQEIIETAYWPLRPDAGYADLCLKEA